MQSILFIKVFKVRVCKIFAAIGILFLFFPCHLVFAQTYKSNLVLKSQAADSLGNSVRRCPKNYFSEVLTATNRIRRSHGLSSLLVEGSLGESASLRATEIAESQELSHDGYLDSFKYIGFDYKKHYTSEILAHGHPSGQSVVSAWYDSRGHRKSLVKEEYNFIGIGCVIDRKGKIWWVEHFRD